MLTDPEIVGCAQQFAHCAYKGPFTPVNLRKMFTKALQIHWSDPAHHCAATGPGLEGEGPDNPLACLIWEGHPDVKGGDHLASNQITVAPDWTFDPDRPLQGVYVGVGMGNPQKLGLDNFLRQSEDTAHVSRGHNMAATVRVRHIHRDADTALNMATSSYTFFYLLREWVRDHPDFMAFEPIATDMIPKIVEKTPERHFQVDLSWSLVFTFRVAISLESHRIKKITQFLKG